MSDNKVGFIENKPVDWNNVQAHLVASTAANHFSNFGPASKELEARLHLRLGLPDSRRVVMASSATTALMALLGVISLNLGHRARVLTSAFGFYSSRMEHAADAVIVDCTEDGLLDLSKVSDEMLDRVDVILPTNIFGIRAEMDRFETYCREHGKIMLLDNATTLDGYDRSNPHSAPEIISFHHTKPWGMGEAGCAIIDAEDEEVFRALLGFGVGLTEAAHPYALNAKISDFACALVLDRLDRIEDWGARYQAQYDRIANAADRAGLRLFSTTRPGHIHAHVALQLDNPIHLDQLPEDCAFVAAKYYKPLADGMPVAARLYDHMLNIPAHADTAALSDADLDLWMTRIKQIDGRNRPARDDT